MLFRRAATLLALLLSPLLAACGRADPPTLRLATTTSTEDSGLLQAILPDFQARYGARVEVVAVGTGQALALGEAGDADVLLVHDPAREQAFVAAGHGTARYPVMYNDFVIVGPAADPAGVAQTPTAAQALAAIARAQAPWASRGDQSGTHSKELALWRAAGITPNPQAPWYASLGQGMGPTLIYAAEQGAYTLSDRATYLAMAARLEGLAILFGGPSIEQNPDPALYNPYSVIPVNPGKDAAIQYELAMQFVEWITSLPTQQRIADYGLEQYGQPLFYPDSELWRAQNP
jgi:tungstate transport system substrate-binding protein